MCGALVCDGECVTVFRHWRLRRRISSLVEALVVERISDSSHRAIHCQLSLHGCTFSVVIALSSLRFCLHAFVFSSKCFVLRFGTIDTAFCLCALVAFVPLRWPVDTSYLPICGLG